LEATQIAHHDATTTKPQVIKAPSLSTGIKADRFVHPICEKG